METLTPRSRQIFTMSRFEGLKNREIAAELGISVKVVEKHITKALSAFKAHFKKGLSNEAQYLLLAWFYSMM